jgi:hypothetical protein
MTKPKRKIKVVKRGTVAAEPVIRQEPPAKDPERGMTNIVKNWISERSENRQAERISNDRQSRKWHGVRKPSRKPA